MYTCNTCSLQFPTAEDQRSHMKTDWHRYNLKRRVASLPAIDEALFNEKVSKLSIEEPADAKPLTKKEQRRKDKEALLEKKRELLEIARQNILKSKSEAANTEKEDATSEVLEDQIDNQEQPTVTEESKELTEETKEETNAELTEEQMFEKIMNEKLKNKVEIPLENCLFCNKKFPNLEVNVTHMHKNHGFYIPEQKYLTDKAGLVKYMSEKIGVGNLCIVCDFQGRSLEAVRAHMLAKKHCQIPYDTENDKLEISEFYDFSSTYHEVDGDEEEWEDVEEEGVEGSDSESGDEELPQQVLYNDGVELHLPSGIKIGNRALSRYYKQNLRPEAVLTEGQGTVIAAESRHLVTVQDRQQLMEKKRVWKNEKHHQDRDDRRAAKFVNNQPHYRDQLLQ